MRWLIFLALMCRLPVTSAGDQTIHFTQHSDSLEIQLNDQTVARYLFKDAGIGRPCFVDVKTASGLQVTRNHPPDRATDLMDHENIHSGLWLSFGDLSGHDYWRLKAKTEHVRFLTEPRTENGVGTFSVLNRYLTTDGKSTVCEEVCEYKLRVSEQGYMIEINSKFTPGPSGLVFGDQEEMGLGLRVASSIAVDSKKGGRIIDSAGRINGSEVWGKTADWCDYSGLIHGRWAGVTVMSSRENFHPSWSHARDYGFIAINPFGRNAFTKEAVSRVEVKPGATLKLRYAAFIHETEEESGYQPQSAWKLFEP